MIWLVLCAHSISSITLQSSHQPQEIDQPSIHSITLEHLRWVRLCTRSLGCHSKQDAHSLPPWSLYSSSGDRLHRKLLNYDPLRYREGIGQDALSRWPCNGCLTQYGNYARKAFFFFKKIVFTTRYSVRIG